MATCSACQNVSPQSARTHVLAAKLSLVPSFDPHFHDLFAHFCPPHSPLPTHAHTHPLCLAEIAPLRALAKKNIDDKHFRAFPAYIIYANISLHCPFQLPRHGRPDKKDTDPEVIPPPSSFLLPLLPLDTAEMPMARGYFPSDYLNCFYWPFNEAYASCAEQASTVTRRQTVPLLFLPSFLNVSLKHSLHGAHKGAN